MINIISSIRYPEIADPLVQELSSASCSQTWAISSWIMAEENQRFLISIWGRPSIVEIEKAMKTEIVLDIQDWQLRETVWSFSPNINRGPQSFIIVLSPWKMEVQRSSWRWRWGGGLDGQLERPPYYPWHMCNEHPQISLFGTFPFLYDSAAPSIWW